MKIWNVTIFLRNNWILMDKYLMNHVFQRYHKYIDKESINEQQTKIIGANYQPYSIKQ